ncbi:3-hydroxybutyryl-CoA dehydrogenase, partial [bacterium]
MAEKLKFEDLQSPLMSQRKTDDTFQIVGVIGLGVMGQGIAETIAT